MSIHFGSFHGLLNRAGGALVFLAIVFSSPVNSQVKHAGAISNESFLSAHPDLQFRLKGMDELKNGNPVKAIAYFKRSAFFGDKPSQAMIATLYWEGRGATANRALGYAWMDLAAERQYPDFLLQRERYWAALDEGERETAIKEGREIYARYGDAITGPRIATVLRRASRQMAGSRTGFSGNLRVIVPMPGGNSDPDPNSVPNVMVIDGSEFYAPEFWEPHQYQRWHDTQWKESRMGRVEVGELYGVTPASRVQKKPLTENDKPRE